jgi:phosphoglycolate phosphatase-like HAD superfamily hydrolase
LSNPEILHPHKWIEADAYLFDIDGTLLNARGRAHYYAFNSALREIFGVNVTIDGVPWHGNTDTGILRAVLRREGIDGAALDRHLGAAIAHMCAEVERNRMHVRAEVCPSIPSLVRLLHTQGKLLGVASGNFAKIGWVKIEAAGLRDYFSFGSFSDDAEQRSDIFRNAIAEARGRRGQSATVCVVGDTPADVQAARANNIPIVAVATGVYSAEQLAEHRPDVLLGCCDELFAIASV